MRHYSLLVTALALAVLCLGCPPSTRPDLIVCEYTVGTPEAGITTIEVPVSVTVCNVGVTSADVFKVALHYTVPGAGTFVVAFTVPGQSSMWYPFTSGPLAAGSSVVFAGNAVFPVSMSGQTVSMWAEADSCSGDEFMPSFCRVQESNEGNNDSDPETVVLP